MAKGVPITQDKIKARKRKKRLLIFLGAIVCLAIIVFGLSSISSLSIFEIKNIEISGASDVDNLAVQTLAKQSLVGKTWGLFPHSDIFFVSAKRLADNIVDAFPSMANVSVKKIFFNTLTISVEYKEPSALWCLYSICDSIDSSGIAFQTALPSVTSSALVFTNGSLPSIGQSPDDFADFGQLIAFARDLPQKGLYPLSVTIGSSNVDDIYVSTSTYLIVDPTKDVSQSLNNLDNLFTNTSFGITAENISSLQYIDLRFPDKIFYK